MHQRFGALTSNQGFLPKATLNPNQTKLNSVSYPSNTITNQPIHANNAISEYNRNERREIYNKSTRWEDQKKGKKRKEKKENESPFFPRPISEELPGLRTCHRPP